MNRFRRRRLRSLLAVLATVALLFAQTALAHHAFCAGAAQSFPAAAHDDPADCAPAAPADDSILCDSHCSQGELSHDATRAPDVPAMGPAAFVPVTRLVSLPHHPARGEPSPHVAWHRPTPHPASVLLI